MVKNHNLAQAISDAGWSTFVSMLEYKADWYGKNILKIGRFDPSSKTCSNCGTINKELTLKDREWTCSSCSTVLDRDINAAINIKSFALKNNLSGEHTLKKSERTAYVGGSADFRSPTHRLCRGWVVHHPPRICLKLKTYVPLSKRMAII